MKCIVDSKCRKTIGEFEFKMILYNFIETQSLCLLIPECIDKCTINEKAEKIAACAYICEMTHGYENSEFLDVINCFLNNQCFSEYPRDGICYGTDDDGVKSLTSLDQVLFQFLFSQNCTLP